MSGAMRAELRLERGQHPRGLVGVGAVVHAQLAVGRRDAQLVEEDPGQLVVVVLARVDQHLLVFAAQRQRHGGGLHELRPVPDDGGNSHCGVAPTAARCTIMAMGAARKLVGGAIGRRGRGREHAVWYLRYQVEGVTRDDDSPKP